MSRSSTARDATNGRIGLLNPTISQDPRVELFEDNPFIMNQCNYTGLYSKGCVPDNTCGGAKCLPVGHFGRGRRALTLPGVEPKPHNC